MSSMPYRNLPDLPFGRYVPVWIDDFKQAEGFEVTRCVYLSLTVDSARQEAPTLLPLPASALGAAAGELGLLVLSLEAIVTGPADRPRFESAEDFERLYDLLARRERRAAEERVGWDLELGFIWLPNPIVRPALEALGEAAVSGEDSSLEPPAPEPPALDPKGQALRVEINLFLEALAASVEERVPAGTPFVERALSDPALALELVRASPRETRALLEFSRAEVEKAGRDLEARQADPEEEVLLWRDEEERLMRGDRPVGPTDGGGASDV
jgi:hypothetical protein